MRIPGPDWNKPGRVKGESGVEGGGVVESEVCAVPVEDYGADGTIGGTTGRGGFEFFGRHLCKMSTESDGFGKYLCWDGFVG